jgi:hypothetical protein
LSSRALAAGESARIDKSLKVSKALFFQGRISCASFSHNIRKYTESDLRKPFIGLFQTNADSC